MKLRSASFYTQLIVAVNAMLINLYLILFSALSAPSAVKSTLTNFIPPFLNLSLTRSGRGQGELGALQTERRNSYSISLSHPFLCALSALCGYLFSLRHLPLDNISTNVLLLCHNIGTGCTHLPIKFKSSSQHPLSRTIVG
jgi:hypothetical protein